MLITKRSERYGEEYYGRRREGMIQKRTKRPNEIERDGGGGVAGEEDRERKYEYEQERFHSKKLDKAQRRFR